MSERMIELQRAKLGLGPLPTTGTPSPSAPIHNSSRASTPLGKQSPGVGPGIGSAPQTPQQVAATVVLSEDAQKKRFLHRLQRRNDSHPTATDSTSGPTVPTALSRRILQRQGVGYLDDTVAAAVSASADRFLATVFQQALACRDQRLKGAEMAREAARHRKRHMQHYEADMDDRKRRKVEREQGQEKKYLNAIAAVEALKKGGGAGKAGDDKKKKKNAKSKSNDATKEPTTNGVKGPAKKPDDDDGDVDDDEESYDSIDEEEDYYQERLGDTDANKGRLKGDDEEDDDTLLLRDLEYPLGAWDFHLTGKEALLPTEPDSDDEEGDDEVDEQAESSNAAAPHQEDNGNEEGMSLDFDGRAGDDGDVDQKRKATSSPVPKPS